MTRELTLLLEDAQHGDRAAAETLRAEARRRDLTEWYVLALSLLGRSGDIVSEGERLWAAGDSAGVKTWGLGLGLDLSPGRMLQIQKHLEEANENRRVRTLNRPSILTGLVEARLSEHEPTPGMTYTFVHGGQHPSSKWGTPLTTASMAVDLRVERTLVLGIRYMSSHNPCPPNAWSELRPWSESDDAQNAEHIREWALGQRVASWGPERIVIPYRTDEEGVEPESFRRLRALLREPDTGRRFSQVLAMLESWEDDDPSGFLEEALDIGGAGLVACSPEERILPDPLLARLFRDGERPTTRLYRSADFGTEAAEVMAAGKQAWCSSLIGVHARVETTDQLDALTTFVSEHLPESVKSLHIHSGRKKDLSSLLAITPSHPLPHLHLETSGALIKRGRADFLEHVENLCVRASAKHLSTLLNTPALATVREVELLLPTRGTPKFSKAITLSPESLHLHPPRRRGWLPILLVPEVVGHLHALTLHLSYSMEDRLNPPTDTAPLIVEGLRSAQALGSLTIDDARELDAEHLASLLSHLPELRHLSLAGAELGPKGLEVVLQAPCAQHLETLALVRCGLGEAAISALVRGRRILPQLRELDLSDNAVSLIAMQDALAPSGLRQVEVLKLDGTTVSRDDLLTLTRLIDTERVAPRLRHISLRGCEVLEKARAHLEPGLLMGGRVRVLVD